MLPAFENILLPPAVTLPSPVIVSEPLEPLPKLNTEFAFVVVICIFMHKPIENGLFYFPIGSQ